VPIKTSAGPLLERKGDLTAILTSLEKKEVFFLDEIHRLQPAVEEVLYPAMEDFRVDPDHRPGAGRTDSSLSAGALHVDWRDHPRGADYGAAALALWHRAPAGFLRAGGFADHHSPLGENPEYPDGRGAAPKKSPAAAAARRASPTACCAARATFAEVRAAGRITRAVAQEALQMLGVDESGLDEVDRNLMIALLDKYGGGPVGLGTLAAVLSEEEDAIEEIYEPYLMQIGMIDRTPRGRVATIRAPTSTLAATCRSASPDSSESRLDAHRTCGHHWPDIQEVSDQVCLISRSWPLATS